MLIHFAVFDKISKAEVEEMVTAVDRNNDGKISYSEFRVMLGAMPLLIDWTYLESVKILSVPWFMYDSFV